MKNNKLILSTMLLYSSTYLVGCSNKDNTIVKSNISSNKEIDLSKIELLEHENLNIKKLDDENSSYYSIDGYKRIKYDKQNESLDSNIYLIPGYKVDLNYGKDILKTLFNNKSFKNIDENLYLEGYEYNYNDSDSRYIQIKDNSVIFKSHSYNNNEISLKLILSMEEEIKEFLSNILFEKDIDEVIKFLKNEIYKSKNLDENYTTINLNNNICLQYKYNNYKDVDYSNVSFEFNILDNNE